MDPLTIALAIASIGGSVLGARGGRGKLDQFPQYTPEQQETLRKLYGQISGSMDQMGGIGQYNIENQPMYSQGLEALTQRLGGFDPTRTIESFEANVAQPAMKQFEERTAPAIQERFIGGGAGRSSALGQQLAASGTELQARLAGQKSEMLRTGEESAMNRQMDAIRQALGYAAAPQASHSQDYADVMEAIRSMLGSQPYGYVQQPPRANPIAPLLAGIGSGMGTYAGQQMFNNARPIGISGGGTGSLGLR